jgi:hypothetical protein
VTADLYLVREENVPVEELQPGDKLLLARGRVVIVERVDEYDGGFVVRWWRRAEQGEPGHKGLKPNSDKFQSANDGRYLGSLIMVPRGHCWKVKRG